jgi:hypothetical protein
MAELIKVDLSKLTALRDKAKGSSQELMKWKRTAAQQYRSFLFARFDRFSRGGGNWRNTKRRKAGKTKFILRMTHTLFKSLSPVWRNLPGQYQRINGDKIEVGIKGGKHPRAKITVGRLAAIHNNGEGIMPKRQIMVRPDKPTTDKMVKSLDKALKG